MKSIPKSLSMPNVCLNYTGSFAICTPEKLRCSHTRRFAAGVNCLRPKADFRAVIGLILSHPLIRALSRHNVFQQEGLLAIRALGFAFVGDHQQSAAFRTGLWQRPLPGSEITSRVIRAAIEGAALARLAFHQFAAILRALDADLFQPGFCVAAGREIRSRR